MRVGECRIYSIAFSKFLTAASKSPASADIDARRIRRCCELYLALPRGNLAHALQFNLRFMHEAAAFQGLCQPVAIRRVIRVDSYRSSKLRDSHRSLPQINQEPS